VAVIHSDAPPVHNPARRNLWFGAGSVLLLLFTVWMIWFDYHRPWKRYQREFRRMEIDLATQRLDQVTAQLDADPNLQQLLSQLEQARTDLSGREADLSAAHQAVAEGNRQFHIGEERWKVEKSYYDAEKFNFEEARKHAVETITDAAAREAATAGLESRFKEFEDRYTASVAGLEQVTLDRDAAVAQLRSITAVVDDLNKKISRLTEQETALRRNIDSKTPRLTTHVRDLPIIDMAAPSIKVEQVVLPNLMNDINFMRIPKVDRCVTCHKGIADAAFEGATQPFAAHPRLDLYLSDSSPHPYDRFGCTACHLGLDRATSFDSAMHTPRNEEQEHDWAHRFNWKEPHYWDLPQLPAQHAQAACRTCHLNEARVRGADRYNRGLDMLEKAGCYGCHKLAGYEQQRKAGPDLRHIASKVSRDWAYHWVENPRSYRPTTWMPQFFYLSNTNGPEDQERNKVEIASMVSYLFAKSESFTPRAATVPAGNPARGRELSASKGCLGCHRIGENPTARGTFDRDFGPALDRVGDKVSAAWLYDWVRDPKHYFPETNMPDLRLTDQEAADIVAHLMTLRGAPAAAAPALDTATLDAVTMEYLRAKLTDEQARAKSASMSAADKQQFLGEKLIGRYGCFGCHNIAGFEETLPIGTELTQEGTKMITRLDFGYVHIPHTRPAWFLQKMKDPRIFDQGKVKLPQEKLKMPDFGFTDEEADVMVTLILSLQKDVQPMESHRMLDERTAAVERGRRIIQDRNCRGCHIIEEKGGAIREVIKDQAFYPPNLLGEGQKVQSDWLFDFVKGPTEIRPWLTVKMPTFGFDDAQATDVVKYFAAADSAPFPFHSPAETEPPREVLAEGRKVFDSFKCLSCHTVGTLPPGVSLADLAPDLTMAKDRLRHDWIVKWLRDPQRLLPGTRMPGFFYSDETPLYPDADTKMVAVKEYLLTLGGPSRGRTAKTGTARAAGSDRAGF